MKNIASEENLPFIDTQIVWKEHTNIFADFIHPNAKGHELLGTALEKHLRSE